MAVAVNVVLSVAVNRVDTGEELYAESISIDGAERDVWAESLVAWLLESMPDADLRELPERMLKEPPANESPEAILAVVKPRFLARLFLRSLAQRLIGTGKNLALRKRLVAVRSEIDALPVGTVEAADDGA